EDLVSHLRASDARYRPAVPTEDHFLSLDPTSLTVDLLEQHLLAAETSAVAVGAARGTLRPPFFEGCSPSPLAPSYASAAAADVSVPEDVGAACASAKHRSSKGKGGQGGSGGSGGGGGGSRSVGGGSSGGGGGGGSDGGSGGSGGGDGGSGVSGSSGGGGTGGGGTGTRRLNAILSAMYSLSISAEGDCYRFVPPDPGIAAAALGASEFGTLIRTAPPQALHTFTLDSGASACVARSSTVLPCPAVPSSSLSGLHLPSFSTNLVSNATLQDAMVTTTTPGGQRVLICTCTRTGRHLATFTRRPGSSLYTLATEPPQVAASAQVSTSGQAAASCSCRLVSHQNLLWHHRLGHPSLPRLRGMHSRLLVSGLPRSLPPLPPSPAPPCLPCVEGRQRVAPHSSSFPPTTAPLQTLHMDTSPTLRWTGKVGDASVFRIWGSRAFVRDTSVDKLSPRAIPCVFLGFVPYAPGWRFYHPTSCRVFPSTGHAPSGVSQVDPLPGPAPVQGAETGGTVPGGAETGGAEPGGAEPGGVEPRGAALEGAMSEGAESGGAKPPGAASSGGSAGALPRLSPQQLREWFVRCARLRSGATGAWGARAGGAGGAGVAAGASVTRGTATTDPGGARTRGAGVGGPSVGGAGAGGAGALDPGGAVWPRPYFVPLLQQVLVGGLTERCEPASCPVWPVRTIRCVPHSRPPPVPSTHAMALCPSSVPLRVPLPPPPESSLPKVPDPESDRTRAASPPIARLLATAVTDPSFESAASSALVAELLDFAASCRLDYTTALVAESAESESASPLSLGDPDARDIRTPPYNGEAITGPYSTQGQAAMDAKMASWKFTGTYIDEVPTPGANIVDGMWIFRVKRLSGPPPAFKARYVA
ncbi:unnamed protein product, partial [Closterium sp. NIES-54]